VIERTVAGALLGRFGGVGTCQAGFGPGVADPDEDRDPAGNPSLLTMLGAITEGLPIAARLSRGISASHGGGIDVLVQGLSASTTSSGV
jgi:hypothetical protein